MPKKHIVKPGECMLSLAYKAGIPLKRLCDNNAELLNKRQDPGILLPGDIVTIPEKELKEEEGQTEQKHIFRKKVEMAEVRLKIYDMGEPRANEKYWVEVGDQKINGQTETTDEEGLVVFRIRPDVEKATVVIGNNKDRYELLLGHLDPLDSIRGIHERLENLGIYTGGVETDFDDESRAALAEVVVTKDEEAQQQRDPGNWEDEKNRKLLKDEYGS